MKEEEILKEFRKSLLYKYLIVAGLTKETETFLKKSMASIREEERERIIEQIEQHCEGKLFDQGGEATVDEIIMILKT